MANELDKYVGVIEDNIPQSAFDSLSSNEFFNNFTVENGRLQRVVAQARRTNNPINNPAPEDRSLFQNPDPTPINVPSATPVVDAAKTNWTGNSGDGGFDGDDTGQDYSSVAEAGQTSRPIKRITQDAPEEVFTDGDPGLSGVVAEGGDGSDTDGPRGLNSDPNSITKVNNPKDAAGISGATPKFDADLSAIEINPRPNELNKFSSYTYNLALYMLNSKSYVNLLTAPSTPQAVLNDSLLLMRSGGVGNEGRNSALEQQVGSADKFYIDDLEMSSVSLGPSKTKQNTNVTDIRFKITEPRGVTLLETLQDAAALTLVSTKERYIHAPYILEIKFKGYDETGQPMPASSTPKYVPVKITDINFEVTASGTEYSVQAIPYAHDMFGQISSTIPMNVELTAATIGNIFSDQIKSFTVQPEERVTTENGAEEVTTVTPEKIKYGDSFKTLGDALTDYQKDRTKDTIKKSEKREGPKGASGGYTETTIPAAAEGYDTFSFLIATEIANSKLNTDAIFDALDTPTPTGQKKDDGKANKSQFEAYAASFGGGVSLDKDRKTFKINAGTDITKLLNLVIMHSDYIDKNIDEKISQATSEGVGIKWFKIKPVLLSAEGDGKGFDAKDGRYKYHIQYVVEPSVIYYHDFPWAPKSKPKGNGIHKVYDYIFSGKNTEVLNFDLKYKSAFLQAMTAGTGSPFANKNSQSDFAPLVKEQPQSVEGNTTNTGDNVTRARGKDLFSSIMSDGVDMVELNLDIIGDPAYITTSDFYWQDKVRKGEQYTSAFMPDNTINFELSMPFAQVNLKTPVDYDEISGLANPNTATNSSFSGIYKVTGIDSSFSGGQFQQKLTGVRAPMQVTKAGVARDAKEIAGKERIQATKDNEKSITAVDSSADTNRPNNIRASNSGARVVNPFEANRNLDYGETAPYNVQAPAELNSRLRSIQIEAINYQPDSPSSVTDDWNPTSSLK